MSEDFIIYSPGALQAYGHAYDYAGGLGLGLASLGMRVHIVAHHGSLTLPDGLMAHPASPRPMDELLSPLPSAARRHAQRLTTEPRLLDTLARLTTAFPDAPVLFETFEYMSLARSLKRLNLPYAASIFHSTTFRSERDGLLRSAYKRSSSSAARRIAERMDTVYVHGERMRARLVEQLRLDSASRVRVLAHGAPHPASIRLPDRPAARKQLGIPETANVLLSLGTLRKDKELSLMVGAVAQTPGWMLLHAGPEGDVSYTELERLGETAGLGDRLVIHRRFIPAQDHALYFGSADLVAALYEPEMTHESGTAKRVRAFSRPLLASGPADLTDYVRDNGVGYTVEHPTPSAAALALAQHASKSTSEKLDLEARVRAVGEALSWSSVAASIVRDWQAASSRVP